MLNKMKKEMHIIVNVSHVGESHVVEKARIV